MRDLVDLLFRIEQSRWTWRFVALAGSIMFAAAFDCTEIKQAPRWRLSAINGAACLLVAAAMMGRRDR